MTGSLADAEDLLQETLLRAWRGLDGFEGRSSFRSWLYRIATNACLDALEHRGPRSLPQHELPPGRPDAPPPGPGEPLWLEPYPDQALPDEHASPDARYQAKESVVLAFLVAIQRLPPRQRAVLLLRDVVGLRAQEVATLLDTSVAAANSALQRARETVTEEAPEPTPPSPESERQLLRRYVEAWHQCDANALVALLKEDATLSMPPHPLWLKGAASIGAFLRGSLFAVPQGTYRALATRANGRPAVALYSRDSEGFRPLAIVVLEPDDGALAAMDAFVLPGAFSPFGLPPALS